MNWSMPRPVLKLVAALIVGSSVTAFLVGALTAPPRGRLPGVAAPGASGEAIQAQDATPLLDERIEGAPPPVELTEEEKAELEAEKAAKATALALARAEAEKGAPAGPESAPPPPPPSAPEAAATPDKPAAAPKPEEPVF